MRFVASLESTQEQRPRTKLREFAAAWLERRAPSLKPGVRRKYSTSLTHILPELGELYLDAISPADVERYVATRAAAGNTVLNELRLLRTIARDSIVESYAHRYWCERVKGPAVARYSAERPNLLTPAAAARVLLELPKQWLGLVLFLMTTGLRIGEATALRWIDVDVDAGVATVRRGNDRGVEITPKTEASYRAVPVLREIAALWGDRHDGYVFPARSGKLHRGSPLRTPLAKACAAAGVARVTAHGLRRTFNNEGRKHASGDVLRSVTGHATEAMTSHYSLVADGEKAELSRAVAAALGVLQVSSDGTPEGDKPNDAA